MTTTGIPVPESITTRADAAHAYLARGWAPLPVPAGSKNPGRPGWQATWITHESVDTQFAGDGNIGILLGDPSVGLVDIDLDCEEAVALADQFLPPTGAVTGRPNRPRTHRWYIARGAKTTQFKDPVTRAMLVELRSTGAQTLVGPSIHPDDHDRYDMLDGEPAVVDAAVLLLAVAALAHAVEMRRYPDGVPTRPKPTGPADHRPLARSRDDDATVLRRAIAYLDTIRGAVSGSGGHDQTYTAATAMVHGFGLPLDVAFTLMMDRYNPRCEPPWTEGEIRHKIDDAATKPHDKPFGWLRDAPVPSGTATTQAGAGANVGDPTPRPGGPFPCTDLGNAERFASQHGDKLRYCPSMNRWFAWDGCRWREDIECTPIRLAGITARSIRLEAARERDKDRQDGLWFWAERSESRRGLESMVEVAKSISSLIVMVEELDRDPWAFNVLNGTIDLRTGKLRPHNRDDLITKLAPVRFDPDAKCPGFIRFIERIFAGDGGAITFAQRFIGYSLSGDIGVQHLPIFFGVGANGKSVFVDLTLMIMGEYAGLAPPTLIVDNGRAEHPTELADLRGKRFVVASETEQGATLKLQLVKRLTGDRTIKARYMRGDYFEFARTHKLLMVTNNRPRVPEDSEAVWRRLKLLPFDVVIPVEERDPNLISKLFEEAPGILAWLVRGCDECRRQGLGDPMAVVQATDEYRAEEDHVGKFLEECCDVDPATPRDQSKLFAPWTALWACYTAWAQDAGEAQMKSKELQDALGKRGFPTKTRRPGGGADSVKGRIGLLVRHPGIQAGCN